MRHTKVLVSLLSSTVAVQGASLPVPNQPRTVDPRDETPRGYVPGGSFDAAKFAEPEPEHRPRFRYWVPSGNIDPDFVRRDVEEMAAKGFGGAQYLDLVGYGSNDTESDPTLYAWQSEPSRRAMQVFYETSARLGLKADFPQGPNQGAGVPMASPNQVGSSTELARGTVLVRQGSTFEGALPRPLVNASLDVTSETLVAIVTARLTPEQIVNENITVPDGILGEASIKLDLGSVQSHDVGTTNLTFGARDGDYLMFTFWERPIGKIAAYGGFSGSDPTNNNTWTAYQVDHWSEAGAQTVVDFLDKSFTNTLEQYWNSTVGKYLWEDSLEIPTEAIHWTPGLLAKIRQDRGIELEKYLPFLYSNVSENALDAHYAPWNGNLFEAGSDTDNGQLNKIRKDFYAQLTTGYKEYISKLVRYAHSVGLEYSCQPGYGQPLDIQAAWPLIDAPEIESLFFADNITAYRYTMGAQHLTKKKVLSSEIGAVGTGAYQTKWADLLKSAHASFAAGVNQLMWHGYAYSGPYGSFPKTPGWEAWFYLFSEAHGPRQPSWNLLRPLMQVKPVGIDSLSRVQYIMSLGQPCVDLVFYRLTFEDDNFDPTYTISHTPINSLIGRGYTYEYASPAMFELDSSVVHDGHLSPKGGPGYSALIFDNQTAVTKSGIDKALAFAQAGLPVVFVGSLPVASPYYSEAREDIATVVAQMMKLNNVHKVDDLNSLPDLLGEIEVHPHTRFVQQREKVFSLKRWDPVTGEDYFYIYNGGDNTTNISVQLENYEKQTPYLLDTWSGGVRLLFDSIQKAGRLHIDLTLAPGDYRLFKLGAKQGTAGLPVPDVDTAKRTGTREPITLSNWSIAVQSWVAVPDNSSSTGYTTSEVRINSTDLTRFGQHVTLGNVSGTAIYSTTFDVGEAKHALLDLGACSHTCNFSINGVQGPNLNIMHPATDLTDLLEPGVNTLDIEVSTPLGNFLRILAIQGYNGVLTNGTSTVYNAGFGAVFPGYMAFSRWDDSYGLVSPVTVLPY